MPWSDASTEERRRIANRHGQVGPSRIDNENIPCALFDLQARSRTITMDVQSSNYIPTAIPVQKQQDEAVPVADPFCKLSGNQAQKQIGSSQNSQQYHRQSGHDVRIQGRPLAHSSYNCCGIC
jgi:hypothetical protein